MKFVYHQLNEYFAEQRSHNWHNALYQKCSMNKRSLTKHLFLKITQPQQINIDALNWIYYVSPTCTSISSPRSKDCLLNFETKDCLNTLFKLIHGTFFE